MKAETAKTKPLLALAVTAMLHASVMSARRWTYQRRNKTWKQR